MRTNKPLQYVQILTQLEERLVSLRIAFAQIWELGYKRSQMGLTGSIINVPVNMNIIQKALPQSVSNTSTIAVSLKRRLEYKNAFQTGMVRPNMVMQALDQLTKTTLYIMENVEINNDWKQALQSNSENENNVEISATEIESESDLEQENPSETLIHGFTESACIHRMQDKIIEIAPTQDNYPIGIFKDKYAEEMNFPTLFFGNPRDDDIVKRFSYQKIAQWELSNSQRHFAYHTTNLFFKTIKILIQQVLSTMSIRIRKGQLKGRKLLAKDVKHKPNLEKLLKSDIGYVDFKRIRISLDYIHQLKKNVFAMIRQLGPPTFFLTFTSAEQNWNALTSTLQELHNMHQSTLQQQEAYNINQIDKFQLIKRDPVTCARYYRHRINALKKLISTDDSFFGNVLDYFSVTEFQNRGNEHDHFLIWVKDAPIYGKHSNSSIIEFVDKYITCATEHLEPSIAILHKHHHTKQCRRSKNGACRYNFPLPPVQKTMILEPLIEKNETIISIANNILSKLQTTNYNISFTFQMFLNELDITEDEYIIALRSTIHRPTLFLQRKPSETWNNSFGRKIPQLWKANTDAQFVLNAYAAAMYYSSYMAKVDKSMTQEFKRICKEHQQDNIDAIKMISKLGNTLLNLQQMSSQQAAHIVLSLPLNYSSRKCIFIDTRSDNNRTFILKPVELLNKEPDESENVICNSLIDYYIKRPQAIAHICLAEFVSKYNKKGNKINAKTKPNVIRFINFNKHTDLENHCREQLLLYVPFIINEHTLKQNVNTWEDAYLLHEKTIQRNRTKFTYNINATWGDTEKAIHEINYEDNNTHTQSSIGQTSKQNEQYDMHEDMQTVHCNKINNIAPNAFKISQHPQIMDNNDYYKLRQMLNKEQQTIVKDIIMKKLKNIKAPLHLFLTGGAGTGKTFTAKAIYQALLRIYNNSIDNDPEKPKSLITAFTRKAAYNIGGTTLHSTFQIPFNKSEFVPLNTKTLDAMSKHYYQLHVLLIDEISLVGSIFLRYIDKRLRDIMQTPTVYFGNLDTIFCGDLYQAQLVLDSVVFENAPTSTELMPYNFWKDNIKCYSLKTTMRQKDAKFISVLNKIRIGQQTDDDLQYLNYFCFCPPPIDPTFPFLFYRRKDVDIHNNNMLSIIPGELIVLNAIDEQEENNNAICLYNHTTALPTQINLKPNILVEIFAGNYNTQDSLVNGSDGIFKAYTKHQDFDIIWIKFNDSKIGQQQKKKLAHCYVQHIDKDWVPILRVAKPIQKILTNTKIVIRKQFPIQIACARTIHRSQGLTMQGLAFDPTGIKQHGLTYTTLSRTRSIESLFLLKPLNPTNFKVKQKICLEMSRLESDAQCSKAMDLSTSPTKQAQLKQEQPKQQQTPKR
ncbi:uncharacterized protein LOC131876217 [Cryptomeria japonica]|uniref:uncharacterized protein LOC131876217 n=1 Tax=Cryptomeria japonica TaxID=3369 RepID=UPI0027D9D424|nr:uncharacterized protein LOC131876217 [Cryptomeria japonica]